MITSSLKKKLALYLAGGILVLAAIFMIYMWAVMAWSYSSGDRAGYLQKLSKKGWICKTWEGELSLIALPGAAPEKFYFTVRDEKTVDKINAALGKRVTLAYEQHKGIPSSCFVETEYFVTEIKDIQNQAFEGK